MHEGSTALKKSQASSPGDPGLEMDNRKTEGEKLVIESRYGTIEVDPATTIRFDVIEVTVIGGVAEANHIRDAF